jgi:hypothetical protein
MPTIGSEFHCELVSKFGCCSVLRSLADVIDLLDSKRSPAMPYDVPVVLCARHVGQICGPVIGWVAVQVGYVVTIRPLADKCGSDNDMNRRRAFAAKVNRQVPGRKRRWFENLPSRYPCRFHPAGYAAHWSINRPHIAKAADLVQPFVPRYVAPLFGSAHSVTRAIS